VTAKPLDLCITLFPNRYGDGAEGTMTITDPGTGNCIALDVTAWRKTSSGHVRAKVVVQQQGGDDPEWDALVARLDGVVRAG